MKRKYLSMVNSVGSADIMFDIMAYCGDDYILSHALYYAATNLVTSTGTHVYRTMITLSTRPWVYHILNHDTVDDNAVLQCFILWLT